jgi:hypothetical protein
MIFTLTDFADVVSQIPAAELGEALTPLAVLLAKYGLMRTENMAELAIAARLGGTVVQSTGYDVEVPALTAAPMIPIQKPKHLVEVRTLTSYKNSSGNTVRSEQKVVVRLSTPKKLLDYLVLQVAGMNRETGKVTHVIYYLIPHHALYNKSGDFLTAFDVRLDDYGYPAGDCKWTQWSFSDKNDILDRMNSTPARIKQEVDPSTLFSNL